MAGAETYDFGECTWYVATEVAWVQGGWGNATDWVANAARAGFTISTEPMVGAVVVYAAGDGYSEFGHVAWVRSVYSPDSYQVSEMNFIGWDQVDYRVSNRYDVEGFILPPGSYVQPGGGAQLGDSGGGSSDIETAWAFAAGIINDVVPQLATQVAGFDAVLHTL